MSIAAVNPIVLADPAALAATAAQSDVVIEGVVSRVDRRGKSLFTFEGAGFRKIGRGEVAHLTHDGTTYSGELVAISPRRVIVHISGCRIDHGIVKG